MSLTTEGVFRSNLLNPVHFNANPSLILQLVSTVDFLNAIERLEPEFLYSIFCLLTTAAATWLHHQQQPLAPRRQTGPVWNQRTPALLPAHCQDLVRRSVLRYVQLTCCPATRPESSGDWVPRRGLLVQDVVWTKLGRCSSVRGSCQDTFRALPWYSCARFQMLTQGLGWAGDLFRGYPAFNYMQGEAPAPSSTSPKEKRTKRRIFVLMKAHTDAQIGLPFKPTSKTTASMLKESKWGSNRELFTF